MKTLKFLSLMLIAFVFIMGCAGNYGKFKRQSESESKVTKRELIDNWSDYDIWISCYGEYNPSHITNIIFDKKNDDMKILVGGSHIKVKDQEMWTEIVKTNTASDGDFGLVRDGPYYATDVSEILGLDNQLYGFIIYKESVVSLLRVEFVDENSIRLSYRYPTGWGIK